MSSSPTARREPPDPARQAAFQLLRAVDRDDAYANLVWPSLLRAHNLSGRDAAFATELSYGAIRWRGRHDAVIEACVDRPLSRVQPELLDALRLGVHQLHEMRVPSHAAVHATVGLVRQSVSAGAAGFANAVLRRVASGGDADAWLARLVEQGRVPDLSADPAGHLEVARSHPRWVVTAFYEALTALNPGRTWADTAEHLAANNRPAGVTLAARTGSRDALLSELREQGVQTHAGRHSRLAVRVEHVNPAALPQVRTGSAGVQDEASQLVALRLADEPLTGPDQRWLDMCAGPGGKSALLASAVASRGGSLTAVDIHPHRAELVRETLRRMPGQHQVITADATTQEIGQGYDRVLVDAPCTGLGALRRRPEARWRRSPQDLPALTALQRSLLRRALEVVRPGGLVLYATCSPHLAETEAVVASVRSAVRVGEPLRTWPAVHDTDAMFAVLLRREEST